MSPEVDNGIESDDGFYLLKKDSQRRTTLAKVLAQDGNKICELWMQKIRDKYLGETVLTTKHLARLMQGMKDYLTEHSITVIEGAVRQLKEELDFDVNAINQLQFAIYLYQVRIDFHRDHEETFPCLSVRSLLTKSSVTIRLNPIGCSPWTISCVQEFRRPSLCYPLN